MNELIHYAATPRVLDRQRKPVERGDGMKPSGLWFSVKGEYDWDWWCRSEEFGVERLACAHLVVLEDGANILCLTSVAEMMAFHDKYMHRPYASVSSYVQIDWRRVMAEYDGIIISPYQWDLRMARDFLWYYTWDCASGCVWNWDAVKSLDLIEDAVEVTK